MIYILYNELSNKGKPLKVARKLEKKYSKKEKVVLINIITAKENEKALLERVNENDKVIILGGDGTIHQFFNHVEGTVPPCKVYFRSCGRGNDFARDYKKNKVFEITHLFNKMPKAYVNGNEEITFVNGVGMGVDAEVCLRQQSNTETKTKESYFKVALGAFKTFKPYTLDITIDGVEHHYEKVWLFVVNNGRCFGGGMKITPKAIREDDLLDICIVHGIGIKKLIMIFPSVILGWHPIFKKYVKMFTGKHVIANPSGCNLMQRDGEVAKEVNKLEVKRY